MKLILLHYTTNVIPSQGLSGKKEASDKILQLDLANGDGT